MFNKKTLSAMVLSVLGCFSIQQTYAQTPIQIDYISPESDQGVAFVPFAGDNTISPIVVNDLRQTELTIVNNDLPQQAHSSDELTNSLDLWKGAGYPYLVVGKTYSQRGKFLIDFEVIDVLSGRVLQGKQRIETTNTPTNIRKSAHVISDTVYELITGKKGDFSGRIAYIEKKGTADNPISELKVIDADGQGGAKTVVKVNGYIYSPTWSPDGHSLAYSVQQINGLPVIYLHNVDNGRARLLTPYKGSNMNPSFSPDGSSILFSSSYQGNFDIYRLHLGSGSMQKIINQPSDETQPSFAPDGNSFVFTSDKLGVNRPQIYRYSFASGQITKLTQSRYATSPKFNHNGSKIAFLNVSSAAIMNSSGQIVTNLGNTGIDEAASFSPNSTRVVYASKQGGRGALHVKSLVGGRGYTISTSGIAMSPVWSGRAK